VCVCLFGGLIGRFHTLPLVLVEVLLTAKQLTPENEKGPRFRNLCVGSTLIWSCGVTVPLFLETLFFYNPFYDTRRFVGRVGGQFKDMIYTSLATAMWTLLVCIALYFTMPLPNAAVQFLDHMLPFARPGGPRSSFSSPEDPWSSLVFSIIYHVWEIHLLLSPFFFARTLSYVEHYEMVMTRRPRAQWRRNDQRQSRPTERSPLVDPETGDSEFESESERSDKRSIGRSSRYYSATNGYESDGRTPRAIQCIRNGREPTLRPWLPTPTTILRMVGVGVRLYFFLSRFWNDIPRGDYLYRDMMSPSWALDHKKTWKGWWQW